MESAITIIGCLLLFAAPFGMLIWMISHEQKKDRAYTGDPGGGGDIGPTYGL